MSVATIAPFDAPNRQTIAQGHPTGWQSPHPKDLYELVVIGAGLMASLVAASAGHTVAMVERNLTGGTCVNFGCTPSKSLLRAARAVFHAREGDGSLRAVKAAMRKERLSRQRSRRLDGRGATGTTLNEPRQTIL